MRALHLPDPDLRANVLDTLTLLAPEKAPVMQDQASALVTALLDNAMPPAAERAAATPARIAALRCLTVLPSTVPYLTLQAQKPAVIRNVAQALGDRKKQIRKEAVDCRAAWFLYNAT